MSGKLKIGILLIVVAAVAYFWLGNDKNSVASTSQVETATVDTGDITRTVATSGSVRPLITVEVGSQVSGQIAEILVDFNSEVERDQLLAVIDPQSFESRVLQNRADFRVASSNVVVQRANIDRAQANLRRARLEYERAEPLSKQGTLSISELDAAYKKARRNFKDRGAGVRNILNRSSSTPASNEAVYNDIPAEDDSDDAWVEDDED